MRAGRGVDFQKSFVGFHMALDLAPSSLAVGRFAAKKGSLRSPRGRLVASLGEEMYVVCPLLPTSETRRRKGASFSCSDFWDRVN